MTIYETGIPECKIRIGGPVHIETEKSKQISEMLQERIGACGPEPDGRPENSRRNRRQECPRGRLR